MKPTLLIVDDDEEIRTQMKWALAGDYKVVLAGDRKEALQMFNADCPAVTLLDLGLPPHPNDSVEGMETLHDILDLDAAAKVIIVSGHDGKETAASAVGEGAYDFFCKPIEVDEIRLLLERCIYVADREREYREIQGRRRADAFEGMIGGNSEMQEVFEIVSKVAPSPAPVMIVGESGTGKETVARAIHSQSGRRSDDFVAIDCGAMAEGQLEAELFGDDGGREGLLKSSAGGTLFLGTVDALPAALQMKLLQFLQEQRSRFVGGKEDPVKDTRVIGGTNSDLSRAIVADEFRKDLYFRLAVVVLKLPPLRERGEDVVHMAHDFLERISEESGKSGLVFSSGTLRCISRHSWPGNVSELQSRIQRAVVMTEGKRIRRKDMELSEAIQPGAAALPRKLRDARESIEREVIEKALEKHEWNISMAAADVGVSRPTFYDLMRKLGISRH